MLPTAETTAEQTTDREPVKRDFYNLDNLISELNEEKEEIKRSEPEPISGSEPGTQNPISNYEIEPEPEPISNDVAELSGTTIAGTIDTVFATGCSLYAKNTDSSKYEANEKQQQQLNNAWKAVALKYGYKIEDSPWFNVALLTTAVYLPKLQEAKKDRRFAEMDEKLADMQKQIDAQKQKLEQTETDTK